jgi:hypothetical protein
MLPNEILLAYNGYLRRQDVEWERVRYLCYYSAAPHSKNLSLQNIHLPNDKPKEITKDMLVKTVRLDG